MMHTSPSHKRLFAEARLLSFAPSTPSLTPDSQPVAPAEGEKTPTALATKLEGLQPGLGSPQAQKETTDVANALKALATDKQDEAGRKFTAVVIKAAMAEFGYEQGEAEKANPKPTPQEAAQKAMAQVLQDFQSVGLSITLDGNGEPTITVTAEAAPRGPEKQKAPTTRGEELQQAMTKAQLDIAEAAKVQPPTVESRMKQFTAAMAGLGAAFQYIKGAFNGENDKPPKAGAPGEGGAGKPGAKPGEGGGGSAGRTEVAQMIKNAQKQNPSIKNAEDLVQDKEARLQSVNKQLNGTSPGPALDLKNLNNQKTEKTTERDKLAKTDPQYAALDAQIKGLEGQIKALEPAVEQLKSERDQLVADINKIKNAQNESKEEQVKLRGTVNTIKALARNADIVGRPLGPELKAIAESINVQDGTDGVSIALKINPKNPATIDGIRVSLQKFGMDPAVIDGDGKVNDPKPLLDAVQKVVERVQNPNREITEVKGLTVDPVTGDIKGLETLSNTALGDAYLKICKGTTSTDRQKQQIAYAVEAKFKNGFTSENQELAQKLLANTPSSFSSKSAMSEDLATQVSTILSDRSFQGKTTVIIHYKTPKAVIHIDPGTLDTFAKSDLAKQFPIAARLLASSKT